MGEGVPNRTYRTICLDYHSHNDTRQPATPMAIAGQQFTSWIFIVYRLSVIRCRFMILPYRALWPFLVDRVEITWRDVLIHCMINVCVKQHDRYNCVAVPFYGDLIICLMRIHLLGSLLVIFAVIQLVHRHLVMELHYNIT